MTLPGYDAWKTRGPDWDYEEPEEPEFECAECQDTGWELDGGCAEPCLYCQEPVTLDDLEEIALEERP